MRHGSSTAKVHTDGRVVSSRFSPRMGSKPGFHQKQCEYRERDQPRTLRIAAQDSRPRRHAMPLWKLPAGTPSLGTARGEEPPSVHWA